MRALGATRRGRHADIELTAPAGGLQPCDFLMDEPSVMATENALMAAALTPGTTVDPQRRLRAARPGSRADARRDGRGDRRHRLQRDDRPRPGPARTAARTRSLPTTSRSARSWRSPGVTGGELVVKDTVPEDLRMIRLVFERLGLHSDIDGNDVIVPGGQQLTIQTDAGGYTPKIQDGPWPAFPADLTSVARGAGDPGRGLGDRPRVDVREPSDLHGQAAADGCRDHDLRPAPGDHRRAAQAARRSASTRRTSAPAWRC